MGGFPVRVNTLFRTLMQLSDKTTSKGKYSRGLGSRSEMGGFSLGSEITEPIFGV